MHRNKSQPRVPSSALTYVTDGKRYHVAVECTYVLTYNLPDILEENELADARATHVVENEQAFKRGDRHARGVAIASPPSPSAPLASSLSVPIQSLSPRFMRMNSGATDRPRAPNTRRPRPSLASPAERAKITRHEGDLERK